MSYHDKLFTGDTVPQTGNPFERLEVALRRDQPLLEALTSGPEPLTVERIREIDPALAERADRVAQETSFFWPDETSAVKPPQTSPAHAYGGNSDYDFVQPIITKGREAYNNFYAVLSTPYEDASEEGFKTLLDTGSVQSITYSSNPYVGRAHELFPEFMDAVQKSAVAARGMEGWMDALMYGYIEPEIQHEDASLLTGSRLAYGLFARLMRKDDNRIKYVKFGLPVDTAEMITDADAELYK